MKNILLLAITVLTFTGCAEEDAQITLDEMVNSSDTTLLSQGQFIDLGTGHALSGKVVLFKKKSNGTKYLRFENFAVLNGPDVNVYLSKTNTFKDVIDLGDLKASNGNFQYELSTSIDPVEHPFVLIWCVKYAVLFGHGELKNN